MPPTRPGCGAAQCGSQLPTAIYPLWAMEEEMRGSRESLFDLCRSPAESVAVKGSKTEQKLTKKESKRRPKGAKREPKGSQKEPKGSQRSTKMHPKVDLRKRSRKGREKGIQKQRPSSIFGSILGAKIVPKSIKKNTLEPQRPKSPIG